MSVSLPYRYFLLLLLPATLFANPEATRLPEKQLSPFLQEYCVRCHGEKKQKGQVRFDEISWGIDNVDSAQRWQDVLDVLNGGDMPPEDEKQPSQAELSSVLDRLTGTLLEARQRLTNHGGEITMRRLNQREYANTIRELFGFEVPHDMIPEDGGIETYDTVGAEQFFTSSHFEKYLQLGEQIAGRGFEWAARPRGRANKTRKDPEKRVTRRMREKLADLDNKMRMKKEGKTWQEMGFKDEGEMKIIFSQFKNRAGKPRQYLQYPLVDRGVYITDATNETKRIGVRDNVADPRGTYRLRVRAGVHGNPLEIRKFLRISDEVGTIGVLKTKGTSDAPEVIEMEYRPKIGQRFINLQVEENRADIRVLDAYLRKLDPKGDPASIWVDWVEVEGPFFEGERAFFESLLYPKAPVRGKRVTMPWSDKNARKLIERFAFEAFRKKAPATAYVDQLVALFEENRADGQKFTKAMGEVFGVILASPGFLFLQESGGAEEKRQKLDKREFAIRLAYFLWSCPPDEELYSSKLSDPKTLRNQINRMLADAKAEAFFRGFTSQWAELDRFDAITINETQHFRFNKGIRHSAYLEVLEFFKVLVEENLPASNLIDSKFAVIDPVLGEHYGIGELDGTGFQKVSLPADSPLGGLMTQTAFLAIGSTGERSSPVIRGALVMEKLLHDKPPPPPPNVPELGADNKKPLTNRQLVELHQRKAQCASCHKKMDVIGFGLENFDAIGKWRDTEMLGRRKIPINPGGKLPGGAAFANVMDLKSALLDEDQHLAEELIESMLSYGLGRTIEFTDADDVDQILTTLEARGYRVRAMIHAIVSSPLFRTK